LYAKDGRLRHCGGDGGGWGTRGLSEEKMGLVQLMWADCDDVWEVSQPHRHNVELVSGNVGQLVEDSTNSGRWFHRPRAGCYSGIPVLHFYFLHCY
jgi:hypothetical protein